MKAITTDNKITGIEKIVSITIDNSLSTYPPKYPLINPNGKPTNSEKNNDKNTTSNAIVDPCKVLKHTSLPNLSVPHKWLNEGGAYIWFLKGVSEKSTKL